MDDDADKGEKPTFADFEQQAMAEPDKGKAAEESSETRDDPPATDETEEGKTREEADAGKAEDPPPPDDTGEDGEKDADAGKAQKQSVSERINAITARLRQTERESKTQRENDATEKETLKSRIAELEQVPASSGAAQDGRPDPDDKLANGDLKYPEGRNDPQFSADLVAFEVSRQMKVQTAAHDAQRAEDAAVEILGRVDSEWAEQVGKVEDQAAFEEAAAVVESFATGDAETDTVISTLIKSSPVGTDVITHLSQNPEDIESILKAGVSGAARVIGRIEGTLMKPAKEDLVPPSPPSPPPPPENNSSGSGGKTNRAEDAAKGSFAEMEAVVMGK